MSFQGNGCASEVSIFLNSFENSSLGYNNNKKIDSTKIVEGYLDLNISERGLPVIFYYQTNSTTLHKHLHPRFGPLDID